MKERIRETKTEAADRENVYNLLYSQTSTDEKNTYDREIDKCR